MYYNSKKKCAITTTGEGGNNDKGRIEVHLLVWDSINPPENGHPSTTDTDDGEKHQQ